MLNTFMEIAVQTQDVVSVNIWQIVISLVNLLLIFLMLKKFLYNPVKKTLARRQEQVSKVYEDADEAKKAANAEKQEYEEKLRTAHKQASDIVSNAKVRAERLESDIVREASEKAENMIRTADEEIALERKKAMNEIKDDISAISVEIAGKVIGREIKESDHQELINEFIDSIGDDDE